jgi:hypothetical protein
VRNEIENEINENETKRNQQKRNEINEMKRNKTKPTPIRGAILHFQNGCQNTA